MCETQHSKRISLLNMARKEDVLPTYFFFLDNKEGTMSETFRFKKPLNGLEPRAQVRNMQEMAGCFPCTHGLSS